MENKINYFGIIILLIVAESALSGCLGVLLSFIVNLIFGIAESEFKPSNYKNIFYLSSSIGFLFFSIAMINARKRKRKNPS